METPGSIFALSKATQNRKFSEAIADKYENAGTAPYVGISLVFLNLKQNQILQANTEETIQIIYQLMLQWNNRQNFPLARTTVLGHIRENIEHDLQTLSCENKELYRELNFIWQEIRVLDRKEASAAAKKRVRRQQDYLQRERRKLDEKIQKNLTLIRQTAVQVPAELRPADVRKAIVHQLRQEQSLRTEIREAGIPGKETSGTGAPEAKPFRIKTETRLENLSELFTGFIYRDSFHELYRMLEHRLSDKTVPENQHSGMELPLSGKTMQRPLPNETQKMIRQKQISAGAQEAPSGIRTTPAEIQTADRIANRQISQQVNRQISQQLNQQISRQTNRQLLQTEELAHRITEIREAGITETELLEKETSGTGAPVAKPLGTETETRLRNLSELFTGFIYRDSFRELYRMLEHRLPKTVSAHRLPGETQKMIRQKQIFTGIQEAPAGIRKISAGIQIVNQQISQQLNQQISRQINRQLMQTEELAHRITEIREAGTTETELLEKETPRTGAPVAKPSETETETRLTGETQKIIRQKQISAEVQEAPAGIREISAGIQIVNRIVNRQMSQQVNQQINQQISRQLMQTEALTHRTEENLFRQICLSENIIKAAQTNAQRQFDIRQRDIRTYNEAEPAPTSLKRADPALTGHPAPTTAQTLKTQAAASAQPLKHLAKEQSARKPSEQEAFLNPIRTELQYLKKKETAGAEALREQKQNVKVLTEKINIQEQVIDQMKKARQSQNTALGRAEVKMVADEVLERLHKDIHLQRLRMGMS